MKQYGIESQYIDVIIGDSSLPLWHSQLELDSIITDRKYIFGVWKLRSSSLTQLLHF